MGIKPFYYARIGDALLFSNTLEAVRLHPGVSSRLSDLAIGDFLLFGTNYRTDVSAYEDIKKLPAAHALTASGGEIRITRYWSFPIEEPIFYRRAGDYTGEFRALLRAAVKDRLRAERASINMSGGLDSPTVAAEAAAQLPDKGALQGITVVCDSGVPDDEGEYAGMVARHLGIPHRIFAMEAYQLFERSESPGFQFPEPGCQELAAVHEDMYRFAAAQGPILLTGEGGDPALIPSLSFYRGRRLPSFVWHSAKYLLSHGRPPRLGFRLAWLRWRGLPTADTGSYPCWLNPEFESRAGLRARWQEVMSERPSSHPDRPAAHECVSQPEWAGFFELYDAGHTRAALEVRHPLMDLRVLRFMLRLPTLPWCADKELLRAAMSGDLPEAVLRRPKSPLAGDAAARPLQRANPKNIDDFEPAAEFDKYIIRKKIPGRAWDAVAFEPSLHLRPLNLSLWLRYR